MGNRVVAQLDRKLLSGAESRPRWTIILFRTVQIAMHQIRIADPAWARRSAKAGQVCRDQGKGRESRLHALHEPRQRVGG